MMPSTFQPLHQTDIYSNTKSGLNTSNLHKSMFKKLNFETMASLKNKFASPTDALLSPCSQRLSDHKSKLFSTKSNPTKLNFSGKSKNDDDV